MMELSSPPLSSSPSSQLCCLGFALAYAVNIRDQFGFAHKNLSVLMEFRASGWQELLSSCMWLCLAIEHRKHLFIYPYIYIQVHVYTVYRIPFFGISLPADSCWFSRKAHGNWSCNDVFLSSSWSYRWRNRSMSTWMPWNGLLGLGPSWPRPGGHRHSRHGCYWSYHDLQRDRIRLFLTSWLPAGPWNTKSSWMAASFNDRLHKQLRIGPIRCTSWTCLAGCLAQRARFTIYIYIVTFISGYDIGYMYQCLASDAYIYMHAYWWWIHFRHL